MKAEELVALHLDKKFKWLETSCPDYLQEADSSELLGYIICLKEEDWKDPIKYSEDYETGSLIKTTFLDMSSQRETEINNGSPVSEMETEYLKRAVLKQLSEDEDAGINFTVCRFLCDGKGVFVTFSGILEGSGGGSWSFHNIHLTEEEAILSIIKGLNDNEYFIPDSTTASLIKFRLDVSSLIEVNGQDISLIDESMQGIEASEILRTNYNISVGERIVEALITEITEPTNLVCTNETASPVEDDWNVESMFKHSSRLYLKEILNPHRNNVPGYIFLSVQSAKDFEITYKNDKNLLFEISINNYELTLENHIKVSIFIYENGTHYVYDEQHDIIGPMGGFLDRTKKILISKIMISEKSLLEIIQEHFGDSSSEGTVMRELQNEINADKYEIILATEVFEKALTELKIRFARFDRVAS